MPEVEQITYSLNELTKLMLRDQGIRSGIWMIRTRFAYSTTNIRPPDDHPAGGPAGPAVIAVLVEAGIQKAGEPGPLSVDAAELWREEVVVEEGKKKRKGKKTRLESALESTSR